MLKNLITQDTVQQYCRLCLTKLQTDNNGNDGGHCGEGQKFIDINCDVNNLQQFIATHVDNSCLNSEAVQLAALHAHYPQYVCHVCYAEYLTFLDFIKNARNTAQILHNIFHENQQTAVTTALPTSNELTATDNFERELEFLNEILPNELETVANIENISSSLQFIDLIESITASTAECDKSIINVKECDKLVVGNANCDEITDKPSVSTKRSRVAAFRCEVCQRRFVHAYNLQAHILRVHQGESRPYACAHCDKKYKACSALRYHERVAHNRNESLQCLECGKYYRTEVSLKLHRLQQHLGQKREKRCVCETCGAAFFTPKNLHIHKRVKHDDTSAEKYQCKVCAKNLQSPYSLKYHMLRHHQTEQNYICSVCSAGFARKFMLASHMRNHTSDAQKFPCSACGKRFLTATDVQRHHRLVHLKIKPHVCKQCGAAFGAIKTLRHHMYRHTGEKPYVCEICGLAFRQPTSMKTHRKLHFRENNVLKN